MEAAVSVVNERRRKRRRRALEEHGIVCARVRPGYEVELIDVSAGGALVDSARRLLPGALIELSLTAGERSASIRGRVLRCAIVRLKPSSICYRGAIGFDRDLLWFSDHENDGYSVPTAEIPGRQAEREEATRAAI